MKQFSYIIKDEIGLHARPAGLLAKEAKKYQSTVTLSCKGKSAAASKTDNYVQFAKTLDKAAKELGVNFIGGYSAWFPRE